MKLQKGSEVRIEGESGTWILDTLVELDGLIYASCHQRTPYREKHLAIARKKVTLVTGRKK